VGDALGPFRAAVSLLMTMPGLCDTAARVLVAEIDTDMTPFPSAAHLVSWAGVCPRLDESAGKRGSTRIRQGAPWLKTTLVTAAWAATRKQDSSMVVQCVPREHLFARVPSSLATANIGVPSGGSALKSST